MCNKKGLRLFVLASMMAYSMQATPNDHRITNSQETLAELMNKVDMARLKEAALIVTSAGLLILGVAGQTAQGDCCPAIDNEQAYGWVMLGLLAACAAVNSHFVAEEALQALQHNKDDQAL